MYEHFDGEVLVVHDSRAYHGFNEIYGDRYLGCAVHPYFQSLPKPGDPVEQLTHCECNWVVREGLPDWVCLASTSFVAAPSVLSCCMCSTLAPLEFSTHGFTALHIS